MKIGKNITLPRITITWPHQVQIGAHCIIENRVTFKYDGMWEPGPSIIIGNNVFIGTGCEFNIARRISVGDNCLIASGTRFIDHNHGIAQDNLIRLQDTSRGEITIANDVWIGFNCVVLKGVHIGGGAVVAAGSVVTKSIPPNEIWAGIPAKKIGQRA